MNPMSDAVKRKPLLAPEAMNELYQSKQQIRDAVLGKLPERLVRATVGTAVRLARREAKPEEVLSERVVELVRERLKALARERWKPDTALLLHRGLGEGGHGLSE
jgi:hypothetical protein